MSPIPSSCHQASALLEIGERGMSRPVEIEFASRLTGGAGKPKNFSLLQMRPLSMSRQDEDVDIGGVDASSLVCSSVKVLGNGVLDSLRDAVVVDFHRFDRARSRDAAREVAQFNAALQSEQRPYLLIGMGRWGSTDPWLGIPVTWDQISGARAIVESGFKDFRVTPSQGSHFFQNLTSFQIGYFTVNPDVGEGFVFESRRCSGATMRLQSPGPTVECAGPQAEGVNRPSSLASRSAMPA